MMDEQAFHAERLQGLGGSDMGAILGLNPYRSPFDVWQEKTGRATPFDGNLQTRFGQAAEQFVADEYSLRTGRTVRRHNSMLRHGRSPLIGHVDRLVVPEGKRQAAARGVIKTDLGLECKTAHALAASRAEEWGEDGTDEVPSSYLIQCATYMALTRCSHWDLAVLFGNSDFRVYHLHRDRDLEEMLIEEASRWWRDHVEADMPPDPSSEAEARQRWSRHEPGKVLDAGAEVESLVARLADARRTKKAAEDAEQEIRDRLIPLLADADEIVAQDGRKLATYRANKDGRRTDWRAVADALGADADLIAEHTTTTPGARVLRLAKGI